ncbi:uncharacterized protein KY384_006032 [Bacidia gigantensis]|uniref:uncharacterized protein n=1 Tax=Bacidia gigantensis TaxID=2732470 RepID=UPI001D051DDE|nr:uncharacterized protein KY384_006032 [Bacidia gigantensis]KAG8529396.1 hypothetical protein KY384_006032 [Bacidia gigantensis]
MYIAGLTLFLANTGKLIPNLQQFWSGKASSSGTVVDFKKLLHCKFPIMGIFFSSRQSTSKTFQRLQNDPLRDNTIRYNGASTIPMGSEDHTHFFKQCPSCSSWERENQVKCSHHCKGRLNTDNEMIEKALFENVRKRSVKQKKEGINEKAINIETTIEVLSEIAPFLAADEGKLRQVL